MPVHNRSGLEWLTCEFGRLWRSADGSYEIADGKALILDCFPFIVYVLQSFIVLHVFCSSLLFIMAISCHAFSRCLRNLFWSRPNGSAGIRVSFIRSLGVSVVHVFSVV